MYVSGEYSCQLVIAQSRILPESLPRPHGELSGAVLNTHSGEIVRKAFYKYHKSHIKLCDSQIQVQYFACDVFVKMSTADQFKVLREKELCFQCLYPGADLNTGKHKEGKCQKDYVCKHASHDKYTMMSLE